MNTSGGSILMQPTNNTMNSQMLIGNLNNNSNMMIVENHSPQHVNINSGSGIPSPSRSPNINSNNFNGGSPQGNNMILSEGVDNDEKKFMANLHKFMESRGTPIEKIPIFDHKELNLYKLYNCVISRGGLESVIENKLWRQITNDLSVDPERTDAGFRLRIHYLKFLYPYERKHFLKSDDENFDFDLFEKNLSKSPADKKILHRKKKLQQQLTLNPPHNHHHHNNNHNHHNSNSNILLNLSSQQHFHNSPSSGKSTPENSSPNSLLSSNINHLNSNSNTTNNNNNTLNRDDFMNGNMNNNNTTMSESSFLYNSSILSSPLSPSNQNPSSNQNVNNNSQFNNINILNNNNSTIINNTTNNILPVNNNNNSQILPTTTNLFNSNSNSNSNSTPSVNLNILEFKSLKKYNNYHKLKVSNTPSKKELLNAVLQHFSQHKIDEEYIINSFLKRIKSDTRIRPVSSI